MKRVFALLPLLAVVFTSAAPRAFAVPADGSLVTGRFGPALDAGRNHAIVMARDPYSELPLTVECWVRLRSATARNDLLSSELVLSRGHWALFTAAGSGTLGLALPGYAPAEIKSTRAITDNAWHHVAMILEPDQVRLYVDAQEVAAQPVVADTEKAHHYGWFLIGGEVDEPASACDGLIDEVRISRGVRPVKKLPDAPPVADATTVALWHLDAVNADGETPDASTFASPAWLTAGRSMDEIDRLSFKAGPAPLDTPAQVVTLAPGAAPHPTPVLAIPLDPTWRMAEGGADTERLQQAWSDAIPAIVPGSVHTALEAAGKIPDPKFGRNDAIAHDQSFKTWWFRQDFPRPANLTATRLEFEGVAIHCTVWLNGERLGEHDGMFGGPSFDVAGRLKAQNTLIVKIDPAPGDPKLWNNLAWRKLLVFNNVWGWHYSSIPALGIWRPVRLEGTPAVRLVHPFIATRDAAAGEVSLVTGLQGAATGWSGRLTATIEPENFTGPAHHFTHPVKSRGATGKLHLQFKIPDPRLWWPVDLGEPNLYRLKLSFTPDGAEADAMEITFGLRTVTMAPLPEGPRADLYNWGFVINGRPMFMKGTGWCTMDSSMDFSRARYARIIELAKQQHVQMLRCWGNGMPETDDFFDLCDRAGITVLQEWPTATNTHREQPYDQLEETVRLNTLRVRNHPSLVMWGANNESRAPFGEAIDMMGRLALELDGTRPFHRAEPWGGSIHNYGCWWRRQSLDFNVTLTAPFLGEFGLATMPVLESVQRYLPDAEKNLWPAPPDGSLAHHTATFNTIQDMDRLGQYAGYFTASATMADFIRGSQLSQVIGLRHPLERARTRWPASAGALYYKMNDNYPAASWAVVDWYGAPKIGHYFCQQAYAPLHAAVVFDSVNNILKPQALPVFLLDDAGALKGARWEVAVRAYSAKLQLIKSAHFAGAGAVAAPLKLGEFTLSLWQTVSTPIFIVSEVIKDDVLADRTFYFMNYETVPDCLFKLPRTTLALRTEPGTAIVTNTGTLPAVAVAVQRSGHLDTFTAAENYLWLEPGETKRIPVSETEGLTVEAWNQYAAKLSTPIP